MSTKSKLYTIYSHKSPSGKYYIGLTCKSCEERWRVNGYGYHTQPKFYRAIKKYGWKNFEHQIIATGLTLDEAYDMEKQLIQQYDSFLNGYNADLGGKGAEGHIVSEELKEHYKQLKLGTKWSEEQRKHYMLLAKEPIFVYSVAGEFIKEYPSAKLAAEALNIPQSSIINSCNSLRDYNNKYLFVNSKTQGLLSEKLKLFKEKLELKQTDKVFQYDLTGKLIATFKTVTEAASKNNLRVGSVGQSCSGFKLYIKNTIFLHSNDPAVIKERLLQIKNAPSKSTTKKYIIEQYTLAGEYIATYNSVKEAEAQTGISRHAIKANYSGESKTAGKKYIFKKIYLEKK